MSTTKLLFLNSGWAALAVGAFVAGFAANSNDPGRRQTANAVDAPSKTFRATGLQAARPGLIESGALVRPMTLDQIGDCLRSGVTSKDPIERDLMIAQAMSQVTRQNAPALLAVLESIPWNSQSTFDDVFSRFMLAWGRVDGPSAVAYQQAEGDFWTEIDPTYITGYALRGWAQTDSEAAVAYLNQARLPDARFDKYYSNLLGGLVATDMEVAFAINASVENEAMRDKGIDAITKALQADQASMLAWADHAANSPDLDPSYAASVIKRVSWLTLDFRATAEWMNRNPRAPYSSTDAYWVVERWAKEDPLAALDWVRSSSDPRVTKHLSTVIGLQEPD